MLHCTIALRTIQKMSSPLRQFCEYYKTELQKNAFSHRFRRNKVIDGSIFICFICLTGITFCDSWFFENSTVQKGEYDETNKRYKQFQLRSSERDMRTHMIKTHSDMLHCSVDCAGIGFVDLTSIIDQDEWASDFNKKRKRSSLPYIHTQPSNSFNLSLTTIRNTEPKSTELECSLELNFDDILDTHLNEEVSSVQINQQSIKSNRNWSTFNRSTPRMRATGTLKPVTKPRITSSLQLHEYNSDDNDEVVWQSSSTGQYLSSITPQPRGDLHGDNSESHTHCFVTDSGNVIRNEANNMSKINLVDSYEPSYFLPDHVKDSHEWAQPPRMAMNEHYNKLDYDYVPTPIDQSVPLVQYCPPVYDRDFWDETLTPEQTSRPILTTSERTQVPATTPQQLFANHRDTKNESDIMSDKLYSLTMKAIQKLIHSNDSLTHYMPICTSYDKLFQAISSDYDAITSEIAQCTNRGSRVKLQSSESFFSISCLIFC